MFETLSLMGGGFLNAVMSINIFAMIVGVTIGIVIGCLPGLSAAMGVALLLPMTFSMEASTGMTMLGAIYCGAIFGGSISAILIHTPGTPASAATAIEGYQMTLQGKAGPVYRLSPWSRGLCRERLAFCSLRSVWTRSWVSKDLCSDKVLCMKGST